MNEGMKYLCCATCTDLGQPQELELTLNQDNTILSVYCLSHDPQMYVGKFHVKLSPAQTIVAEKCHICGEEFNGIAHTH